MMTELTHPRGRVRTYLFQVIHAFFAIHRVPEFFRVDSQFEHFFDRSLPGVIYQEAEMFYLVGVVVFLLLQLRDHLIVIAL